MTLALLLFAACAPTTGEPATQSFPDGFAWGAATAGFQVEMGCPTWSAARCDDPASDWFAWVTDPRSVDVPSLYISGDPPSDGPGMWETFEQDADRMASDGFGAYRMSLEWSRLFPDGAAESATSVQQLAAYADPDAVAGYHAQLQALQQRGIQPLVTVNHYTLPLWVHDGVGCYLDPDGCDAKGWVDGERIVPLIALYAGWCGAEFGAEVDQWATLNEPFATTLSGYLFPSEDRSAPPGHFTDIDGTIAVMLHQIEGHAAMYDALHTNDTVDADADGSPVQVGIVMNMTAMHPASDPGEPNYEADLRGVEHADYLYHRLYLDAFTSGAWDPDLDGTPNRTRADLAGRLDFLGINYYNRLDVLGLPSSLVGIPLFDFVPDLSQDLWEPYPEGLYEVIDRASAWGVPMVISENGTPFVEDRGVEILDAHLQALQRATADGYDVRGYYYWSLVDNYEWNHGFGLRFGLYALDPDSKARSARPVLERYREIIATNGL